METCDAECQGAHIPITKAGGTDYIPSRCGEWALYTYGSLQHCGPLGKGLGACGQPAAPALLRRNAPPVPFTEADYNAILVAHRKSALRLDPITNRQPKMLSLALVTCTQSEKCLLPLGEIKRY